jgi:hypothetical protein
MLRRHAAVSRYTPQQTVNWLSWLAHQMDRHSQSVFYLERIQIDWLPRRQHQTIRVFAALVFGLPLGLVASLGVGLSFGPGVALYLGLGVWLAAALFFWHLKILGVPTKIVDTISWSWMQFRRTMPGLLVVMVRLGLVAGLLGALAGALAGSLVNGLGVGLIFGLIDVFLGGLSALAAGLTFGEIENSVVPNEGIRRSARTALFAMLYVGLGAGLGYLLLMGLIGGLVGLGLGLGLRKGLDFGLRWGLRLGLFGALSGALGGGGQVCLKHIILRLGLIRNGSTPWNYVRFLDYAANRILLRKVGGGYAFLHRMLLEYFAARYVEPSDSGAPDQVTPAVACR